MAEQLGAPGASDRAHAGSGPLILIAEDSAIQAEVLREIIESAGYQAVIAADGARALELAQLRPPEILISDIDMPTMDGFALCSAIRQDADLCRMPVILLTSLMSATDVVNGLNAGADLYVAKPVSPAILLARVEELRVRPRERCEAPQAMTARIDGRDYPVQACGQQVLDLLVSTYEDALRQNRELESSNETLWSLRYELEEQVRRLQQTETSLQISQSNFSALVEGNPDGIIVLDLARKVLFINASAAQMLRIDREQQLGCPVDLPAEVGSIAEVAVRRGNGENGTAELRCSETHWHDDPALLLMLRDITEISRLREHLRSRSLHDHLTGLHNRGYLDEALLREAARARRTGLPLGVAMIDIDHFKVFNDTHGHLAGDLLLQRVAALLRANVRIEDIVCRFGGEEFVLLFCGSDAEECARRARQLQAAIAAMPPIEVDGQSVGTVTVSIGVAEYSPRATLRPTEVLKAADAALYRAKQLGRNSTVVAGAGSPGTPSSAHGGPDAGRVAPDSVDNVARTGPAQ